MDESVEFKVIKPPYQDGRRSPIVGHLYDDNVIPDGLLKTPVGKPRVGDVVYVRLPEQDSDRDGLTGGLIHAFYPHKVEEIDGKLHLTNLTKKPSFPPGYGIGHKPGVSVKLENFDRDSFFSYTIS